MNECALPTKQGLYDPSYEHDACGIGFVANIKGQKSHDIILKGIQVLINLTHRGACGCDPETGDGAGLSGAMTTTRAKERPAFLHADLGLIDKALANNHDRKIAEARILEARALRMNAASRLYPEINAGGAFERANPGIVTQNSTLNLYQANFDASFEIDLFGGNRRKVADHGRRRAAHRLDRSMDDHGKNSRS